jgi:Lrp/AsnC family transcriptional regulator, leucine-responsive regulatory protein
MDGDRLEKKDFDILKALQENPELLYSTRKLSQKLKEKGITISKSSLAQRIKDLKDQGVIKPQILIDPKAADLNFSTFVWIKFHTYKNGNVEKMTAWAETHPNIIGLWQLGGGHDYFMHIITKNHEQYVQMVDLELRPFFKEFATYDSLATQEVIMYNTDFPLNNI